MKKQNRTGLSQKLAFTLIELLVVISIIAILAGISLSVFGPVIKRAKATEDLGDLRQIGIGMTAYLADNDSQMLSGGESWVLEPGFLSKYYNGSYKSWQSRFDPRTSEEGKDAHVSFSFNQQLLSPPDSSGEWRGNLDQIRVDRSKLVWAAPEFSSGTGDAKKEESWTGTMKSVKSIPDNGGQMSDKGVNDARRMFVLFADTHVEDVEMAAFKGKKPVPAENLLFDPLVNKYAPAADSGGSSTP